MQVQMQRRGLLIILSSPSGAGKSTLAKRLMAWDMSLRFSVSATTRAPRAGEVDGRDYWFRTRPAFEAMVAAGGMLEHAEVFGNLYGSPSAPVEAAVAEGRDTLFDIDWQGGQQIRNSVLGRDVVSIFILPPSIAELERRLRTRGQDSDEVIAGRTFFPCFPGFFIRIKFAFAPAPCFAEQFIHFLSGLLGGQLYGLQAGRIQFAAALGLFQSLFGHQIGDDNAGSRAVGIFFRPAVGAALFTAVDGDGGVEFGKGAVALAASQKERQADGDGVTRAKLLQHAQRSQAGDSAFGHFFTGTGNDAHFFLR